MEIITRYECQSCQTRWYGAVSQGQLAHHESRWHDGARTVWPVLATVITEVL